VDGDERVQPGSPSAAYDHVLVVKRLEVTVGCRISRGVAGSIRDRRAHGAGGGVPLGEIPGADPVPVLLLPAELVPLELGAVEPVDALESV
jgi:hypothetical protein